MRPKSACFYCLLLSMINYGFLNKTNFDLVIFLFWCCLFFVRLCTGCYWKCSGGRLKYKASWAMHVSLKNTCLGSTIKWNPFWRSLYLFVRFHKIQGGPSMMYFFATASGDKKTCHWRSSYSRDPATNSTTMTPKFFFRKFVCLIWSGWNGF